MQEYKNNVGKLVFVLVLVSMIGLPSAHASCIVTYPYFFAYDFDGNQIGHWKMEYDYSCDQSPLILDAEGNTAFIEDNRNIYTHVDFSKKNWKEVSKYSSEDFVPSGYNYRLSPYEGRVVGFQGVSYDRRVADSNRSEFLIGIKELKSRETVTLKLNISSELTKFGQNYSIAYDYIMGSSSGNWISLLSLVIIDDISYIWLYRYDMVTRQSSSFVKVFLEEITINYFDNRYAGNLRFKIHESGEKGYIYDSVRFTSRSGRNDTIHIFDFSTEIIETFNNISFYPLKLTDEGIVGKIQKRITLFDLDRKELNTLIEIDVGFRNFPVVLETVILLDVRSRSDLGGGMTKETGIFRVLLFLIPSAYIFRMYYKRK